MTTKSNTKLSTDDKKEMESLEAKLAELKKKQGINVENTATVEEIIEPKIQIDDYIRVMSLLPHTLNLSTEGMGKGKIKKFTKLGEIKKIKYADLVDIVDAHQSFVEAGYFYILSKAFIREMGLDEAYERILTKEKIDLILEANTEACVDLFDGATEGQKEIILRLLVKKIVDDADSVNLNIIDKISRVSGVDIMTRVNFIRELREEEEEE